MAGRVGGAFLLVAAALGARAESAISLGEHIAPSGEMNRRALQTTPPPGAYANFGPFYVYNTPRTWSQARADCIFHGQDLAWIDSQEENNILLNGIRDDTSSFWIGLNDMAHENNWVWANGRRPGFTFWETGEPNDDGGVADCGEMWGLDHGHYANNHRWNDIACEAYTRKYVCRALSTLPPPPPPPPPPSPNTCTNTCIGNPIYASNAQCDDGGPGSEFAYCTYGTDCIDCGTRQPRPPPPPRAPQCTNGQTLDLVLVFDHSGSMAPFQAQVLEFARELILQLDFGPSAARMGLVEFDSTATVLSSLSSDPNAVLAAMASAQQASGGTSISSGLASGLAVLQAGGSWATRPKVLLLLTDGEQNPQYGGAAAAIAQAATVRAAGVQIFGVGFGLSLIHI